MINHQVKQRVHKNLTKMVKGQDFIYVFEWHFLVNTHKQFQRIHNGLWHLTAISFFIHDFYLLVYL